MEYFLVKWVHIISSTILFGTGIGSAFYLLCATLTRNVSAIAIVAQIVVVADTLFTATTVVVQPLTGFWLMHLMQLPLNTDWIFWSLALYVVAISCWLPVVWIQIQLRNIARASYATRSALPPRYWRLFYWWVALGIPALVCFLIIFYFMVAKSI